MLKGDGYATDDSQRHLSEIQRHNCCDIVSNGYNIVVLKLSLRIVPCNIHHLNLEEKFCADVAKRDARRWPLVLHCETKRIFIGNLLQRNVPDPNSEDDN